MNYPILILFVLLLESRPEATIYTGKYQGYGPRVFGKFRVNYHLPLFFRWISTCIAVTVIFEGNHDWATILKGASLFPAYAVVQDIGFWLWKNIDLSGPEWRWPEERTWITTMFGGIKINEDFSIPNAWWMGFTATYALLWVMQ